MPGLLSGHDALLPDDLPDPAFAFSWGLVYSAGCYDQLNFFWDWWDRQRKAFPILLGVEIAYFAAILYYIVYWELSGNV
ncbi:hypothetical protein MASR1M12_03060 [Erysipelotrichia bacterium]